MGTRPSTSICLIPDENMAQLEDTVDIFRCLNDSLVFEHG